MSPIGEQRSQLTGGPIIDAEPSRQLSPATGSPKAVTTTGKQTSKKPKELKLTALPSYEKIFEAIPTEGIEVNALTAKFKANIDDTNAKLFLQMLGIMGTFSTQIWIKPSKTMPSMSDIERLKKRARWIPPKPTVDETEIKDINFTSEFVGGVTEISFSGSSELIRDASNMLPRAFYRTFYETSATLSCYVTTDTHTKHREQPELKLRDGDAFQALGPFAATQDLTKTRIKRHFVWSRKSNPSSFISVFNHLAAAVRRADFHYRKSKRIGERVCVAKITTAGLVAAAVHGKVEETVTTIPRKGEASVTTTTRDIEIPIWVNENARPSDKSSITTDKLIDSGADVWISIPELRQSDLQMGFGDMHDYEWLACGSISKKRIIKVMPYDGNKLHEKQSNIMVTSVKSPVPWYFDWKAQMWLLPEGWSDASIDINKKRKRQDESHDQIAATKRPTPGRVQEAICTSEEDIFADICPTCGQARPQVMQQDDPTPSESSTFLDQPTWSVSYRHDSRVDQSFFYS